MRSGLDIQNQGVAGNGANGNSQGIMQHTYEGALQGFGVAGMGIMFTAGGGGNIPACVTAFFICGVGGAAFGAFNYVWNSVGTKPHATVQMDVEKLDNNFKAYGQKDTTTLFGSQRESQSKQTQTDALAHTQTVQSDADQLRSRP